MEDTLRETVDVLGDRPDRHGAFSRDLLAEADDSALQQVVEDAARQLSAPIALVTMLLDHIQFFKAHHGLPPDLAATRATRRDVSFCQYVVRDEAAFEVEDAPNDPRVPQTLVRDYGIQSYLGMPVRVGGTVVGSLCVLDLRPRRFSDDEHRTLERLAALVNERVEALAARRRQARLSLTESAAAPALAELQRAMAPIRDSVQSGLVANATIRAFLRMGAFSLDGDVPEGSWRRGLQSASTAVEEAEDILFDIEAAAGDCEDSIVALDHLTVPGTSTRLSQVLAAAQDLGRAALDPVGGAPLPDLPADAQLAAPRPLAVALLTTALTSVAMRLAAAGATGGIRIDCHVGAAAVDVLLAADDLPDGAAADIAAGLDAQLGSDPSVSIDAAGGGLRLQLTRVTGDDER